MATLDPEELRRRLKRALDIGRNTYSEKDIAQAVSEGRMQSWTENDSLVITEIIQYPQFKAMHVVLAVGALRDVMAMQDRIVSFAREHDCKFIRTEGRKGWDKIMPMFGAQKSNRVIYERALQ